MSDKAYIINLENDDIFDVINNNKQKVMDKFYNHVYCNTDYSSNNFWFYICNYVKRIIKLHKMRQINPQYRNKTYPKYKTSYGFYKHKKILFTCDTDILHDVQHAMQM